MVFSLSPVAGIVDRIGGNAKPSAEAFDECLDSLYLAVGWWPGCSVGYDTDSNGLIASIPGLRRSDGPLSLPFFAGFNLPIEASESVRKAEVTVDVFRSCQPSETGKIFDVARSRSAVVDFDSVPSVW